MSRRRDNFGFQNSRALAHNFPTDLFGDFGFGPRFGGLASAFDNDPFFGRSLANRFGGFDDLEVDMGRGGGNYVCQSYSYTKTIGPDGKPVEVKKIKNERSAVDRDGKRVCEKEEIYNDTAKDLKTVTKERQLDDKKVKVTREIRNNERNVYKEFENLDEEEADDFHRQWTDQSGKHTVFKEKTIEDQPKAKPRAIKYVVREKRRDDQD